MAKLKTNKSLTRLVKRILRNMVAIFEDMEIPDQNMYSPIEATVPIYTRTSDSGYNSSSLKEKPKTGVQDNEKMVQTRLNRRNSRWNNRMDYELASFWMSAETPYWPCRNKTLQKVDVDCLQHTTEELLKEVIKRVYHLYQDSCVKVDGTQVHVEQEIELALKSLSNEYMSQACNETSFVNESSDLTIRISSTSTEISQDFDTDLSSQSSETSEESRLKFTAKQNSHRLHGNPRKVSDILLNKNRLKKRCQKNTIISISSDTFYLSFHFTE